MPVETPVGVSKVKSDGCRGLNVWDEVLTGIGNVGGWRRRCGGDWIHGRDLGRLSGGLDGRKSRNDAQEQVAPKLFCDMSLHGGQRAKHLHSAAALTRKVLNLG